MTPEEIDALLSAAQEHNQMGRYAETEALLRPWIKTADAHNNPEQHVRALNVLSSAIAIRGHASEALSLAEQAVELATTLPAEVAPELIARALTCVGDCHSKLSDFPLALDYFQRALAQNEEH